MHRWMMDRARLAALTLGLWGCLPAVSAFADSRTEVVAALQDLQRWLGHGANGQKWNQFLETDQLRTELAKGPQADPAVVAAIYARYATVTAGPRTAPIERVRLELGDWILDQTEVPAQDLPAFVRAAKDQVTPPDEANTGRLRKRLRAALDRLNERLRKSGENGRQWRQHLRGDDLEAQLAAAESDPAKLGEIYERFVGKHEGLEMAPFVDVRTALGDYTDQVALMESGPEATGIFHTLLDDLATRLETVAAQPSPLELENIGASVTELERYGQTPRVVWAVRRHFAQPNLQLQASTTFLTRALSRKVDDVAPVRDMILGTDIHGTGHTVGETTITPIPSAHQAMLRLMLKGTTHSDTVGYNGPVQIYSTGTTQIEGEKPLTIRSDGLYLGASKANASTRTTINGISTRRQGFLGKIILKAANKRAAQSKRQAERIAARHAEDRIRTRLDKEAGERIAIANRAYQGKFLAPLLRYDVFPERLLYSTSAAGLHVTGVVRASDRLAANLPAPNANPGSDLVLSVHESAINNLARSILLGETMTQERAIEIYRSLRSPEQANDPLPPEVEIDPTTGPWRVTLASDADAERQPQDNAPRELGPVTVRIDDAKIRVTVHGTRYEVGGKVHDVAMDITGIYRLEQQPEGWKLVRDGDPLVFPPGHDPGKQGTLSIRETALRNEMQNRLREKKTFPEVIEIDHRQLQGELAKAGVLHVTQAVADDGWLMIAWTAAAPEVKVVQTAHLP